MASWTEDYFRRTIEAFREIKPDYLIPGHCSGDTFYEMAHREMPRQVIPPYVGTRFTFGA